MNSHRYDIPTRDLLRHTGLTLLPITAFALLMHAGAAFELWPAAKPILDTDRTILVHQAERSGSRQEANVLLLGDSSCLMNVAAAELQSLLPERFRVLNLGTLSYLDLSDHAFLVRRFVEANPGQLRAIVLLMHPEALRTGSTSEFHSAVLRSVSSGASGLWTAEGRDAGDILFRSIGGEIFQERLLPRLLPLPLHGAYGRFYGFNWNLWSYLSKSGGSAIDPGQFQLAEARGNPEYHLAKRFESGCRSFRDRLPAGTQLIAGLTPVPAGFAFPNHDQIQAGLLRQWTNCLKPDAVLADLPATLPDSWFASVTHLNAAGRQQFTQRIAELLRPILEQRNF